MKSVFITGTTSGIGLVAARHMHRLGWQVFAGVLPGEDTSALTEGIGERLCLIPIDITDMQQVQQAQTTIEEQMGDAGLDGLVNNAGVAVSGPMEYLPPDEIRRQMEVNYFGHVQVTQTMLPLIRKATGRIVNITSIFGRVAVPFSGPYCASKFAMEAFTDVLRMELRPWGIRTIAIEPTIIQTPIWDKQYEWQDMLHSELPPQAIDQYGDQLKTLIQTTRDEAAAGWQPQIVADVIAHALTTRTPKTRYAVGPDSKLMMFLVKILPDRWRDWLLLRRTKLL